MAVVGGLLLFADDADDEDVVGGEGEFLFEPAAAAAPFKGAAVAVVGDVVFDEVPDDEFVVDDAVVFAALLVLGDAVRLVPDDDVAEGDDAFVVVAVAVVIGVVVVFESLFPDLRSA